MFEYLFKLNDEMCPVFCDALMSAGQQQTVDFITGLNCVAVETFVAVTDRILK